LLTDEAGAVTDKTTFEAFGEIDTAASLQTSDNSFLYTGEQLDPNTGFVYLRARYLNPGSGRFTQQDAFAGLFVDPRTLHKYAYANADPVNGVDPSGNMTLIDVSSNWGATLNSLGRVVSTFDKILSKLNMALSVVQTMSSVTTAARSFDISDYASRPNSDPDFVTALKNSDVAIATLGANVGKITGDLLGKSVPRGKIQKFVERVAKGGKSVGSNLLVFGPTPIAEGKLRIPLLRPRPKIGTVSVRGINVPILLELGNDGAKGGTFLGLGHSDGAANGARAVQWFRMDWHGSSSKTKATHGDWSDNGYHFHTVTGTGK
jgi:RHS repeat-associated protein